MNETTGHGHGVIVDRDTAGTGTLTRPAPSARRTEIPKQSSPKGRGRVEGGTRQAPGQVPRQRTAQRRQARPAATVAPPRPAPGRTAPAAAPARPRRAVPAASTKMPFIVLLCGLLSGALASTLVISTTLAEGSFQIAKLRQSDSALARQREQLQQQVAQAQSAPVIQQRAYQLGLRPNGQLRFVNLKTGAVATDAGSGGVRRISAPGYTP